MSRSLVLFALICGLLCCWIAGPSVGADGPITLECLADFYAPSDSVYATWDNGTDSMLVAGNHPPYVIYSAESGELVCQGGLPWEYSLPPHSSASLVWDQRDCTGELVPPGRYLMRVYYVFNDGPPYFMVEDAFTILTPASAPDESPAVRRSSWSALRSIFR